MAADDEWTADQWSSYLTSVDSLAAANEDVENVAKFLHSISGIRNAGQLDGIEATELLAESGAPAGVGPRGLVRRAVRAAAQAAEVKRRRVLALTSAPFRGCPVATGADVTAR